MIKLYAVCCAPLQDKSALAAMLPRLDAARTARIARLQSPQKRAQCAAAGLLLTHLFGHGGQPPALTHGSRGKPYLADSRAFFNLSHSGDWVVCAVADNEVGVDAQTACPYNEKIAARHFTPAENNWLADDPDGRFARLWAAKEAFGKFTGFGLVLPPSSYTVPTPPTGRDAANRCRWAEYTLPAAPPVHIVVCGNEYEDSTPPVILNIQEL